MDILTAIAMRQAPCATAFVHSADPAQIWRRGVKQLCHPALGCLVALALATGCSTLSLESAKNLAAIGQESTALSAGNIFVSNDEFTRAMDAEAFFHGYAGTVVPQQLEQDYQSIQHELDARKAVFVKLGETYEAFHALAVFNTASGVASTINELGDTVNSYARTLNKTVLLTAAEKDSITRIGGLATRRVHARRVARSSSLIRARLELLVVLLEDPIVKTQLTTFNQNLTASRAAAIALLWERGLLDPTPLITELAGDAGLKAGKDAAKTIASPAGSHLKDGLTLVVKSRMQRRAALIEQGYHTSAELIRKLIAKHLELEDGALLTPAELRGMIIELQLITHSLSPQTTF
ncbi:MAG: hypothetical protein PHO37_05800 [Kiritimatiellae bacterium]|nr:hypothetical protein [Kiritimatiellia bacterium]